MIPPNIKKHHIIQAILEIDSKGIPAGRRSRDYMLLVGGKHYPPKYTLSLANIFANGEELDPDKFSGGKETNCFLERSGFQIEKTTGAKRPKLAKESKKQVRQRRPKPHTERCPECKRVVEELLRKLFGKVETNYDLSIDAALEDYEAFPFYQQLKAIYSALQDHRGHKNFVRARKLHRCDFYIPDKGFIVEFDESQHFSRPRRVSLENYPADLKLGFHLQRWMDLCEKIDAEDNDPIFRDEQRAWYDSIRDFLPLIKGLKPTVRLFSKEFEWCGFDPEADSDIKTFKALINRAKADVEVISDRNPSLARIVIAGDWNGNVRAAKGL